MKNKTNKENKNKKKEKTKIERYTKYKRKSTCVIIIKYVCKRRKYIYKIKINK